MKKQLKKLQLRHQRIVRLTDLKNFSGGAVSTHCGSYDICNTMQWCPPPPQYGTTIMGGPPTYNQGATVSC